MLMMEWYKPSAGSEEMVAVTRWGNAGNEQGSVQKFRLCTLLARLYDPVVRYFFYGLLIYLYGVTGMKCALSQTNRHRFLKVCP